MDKCRACKSKKTVMTIDGAYCSKHMPDSLCHDCGQLVQGIQWHEMHVTEYGVCADCVASMQAEHGVVIEDVESVYFFTYRQEHII